MFWNKKEDKLKKFENNLKNLEKYLNELNNKFTYYNLFNSLCISDNIIYSVISFKLPTFEEEDNNLITIVIKNKYCYEDKLVYIKLLNRNNFVDSIVDEIKKEREEFIELKNSLKVFGFEITKIN